MQVYFRAIWNKYKFTKWIKSFNDINMKGDVILLILKEDVEFDKCGEVDFFLILLIHTMPICKGLLYALKYFQNFYAVLK